MSRNEYPAKSRYSGSVAADYNSSRTHSSRWWVEQKIVLDIASGLDKHSSVLDIPVGTGRFLTEFHDLGLEVTGADISEDMLAEASALGVASMDSVNLVKADLENLPFDDDQFDAAFCVRFLNWVPETVMSVVIAELARVTKKNVVLHIRTTRQATVREIAARAGSNILKTVTPGGAKKTIKSLARKVLRRNTARAAPGYVLHSQEGVEKAIADAGLKIERRIEVNTRISIRNRIAAPQYFYSAVPRDISL